MMRNLGMLVLLVLLGGCGNIGFEDFPSGSSMMYAPEGEYVDSTLYNLHEQKFHEVEDCTGLHGNFASLAIIHMPPNFPCQYYSAGCTGSFDPPNSILISDEVVFNHEVVHYLLWLKEGSGDPDHTSPLFADCGF